MIFRIHVSLTLVVLLIQVHRSNNDYCVESAKKSVVSVPSCPTSKEMWDLAASKKQCKTHALRQNCTDVNNFIYHCLINHYGNATLEVCARQKIVVAHCIEFNVARGVIQMQDSVQCHKSTFPKCDTFYVSSNAYKYPDCYQLVYNKRLNNTSIPVSLDYTTSSPFKTDDRFMDLITLGYIAAFTGSICGIALFIYCKKRHPSSKKVRGTKSLISNYERHPSSKKVGGIKSEISDYEDHSYSKKVAWTVNTIRQRHPSSKIAGGTKSVISNYENHPYSKKVAWTVNTTHPMIWIDEDFSEDDACENDSLLYTEIEGNKQKLTVDIDEDFLEGNKKNLILYTETEGKIQKRHPSSKKVGGTKSEISDYELTVDIDEDFLEGDKKNLILYTETEGKNQKRNILNTRDTETQTTTDKLGYAMYKTEEDFREENKEESNRYLRYYRIIDKYFVKTQSYIEAENTFNKYGIVIFTGPPGCGKTIAAIHLIRTIIHRTNRTFRKLQHWEELRHIDMNEKSLVFIDNVILNTTKDKGIESWCDMLKMVNDRYHAVDSYYTRSYRLCIIMTVRSKLVASPGGYMDNHIHILNTEFCIDTSRLTELEKNKILEEQIAFASKEKHSLIPSPFLDASFRKNVILPEGPIGFPLCAQLYFCGEEFRRSGVHFFSRPIEYLINLIKDEVEHDKSNKTKSLLLILFFRKWYSIKEGFYMLSIKSESICKQFLNKISPDLIPNFEPLDFRELEFAAQRLLNILVKGVGENKYDFIHDSVYEAVGAYFCETYVTETAMYFPLDIIQHQAYENLTSEQTVTLVTRLMYEALDKRLSEVFSCKIFQSALFSKQFYLQLMKKDIKTIDHFMSVENESSNVKLPCMFWTCLNNLTSLTELFYEIANERNISPCYNFYVSLYGICCDRYSELRMMTDDVIWGNLENMRERVLMFRDDEYNSIIHILISSTFSDSFVAIAIKQLLNDGMSTETRNMHSASPLMIAVQHKLPRIQVIKVLVERSQKFHLCDTTGSTVFHHCLGSTHDDKTCAAILDIIIGSYNYKYLLNIVNLDGDTALSIAAKYSKHSRIQSILLLLEGCRDIVNIVNDDGLTPLHLAVRSFNNCSPCVELECCVRVVILILRGAYTDLKSNAGVKAIDECQYNRIRNILHHAKDKRIMKNELDCILDKLKKHEQTSIQSLNCLGKISKGLQGRITQAISYLQNMSFENVSSQYGLDLRT